jgi:hypothetical protein
LNTQPCGSTPPILLFLAFVLMPLFDQNTRS